MRTGYSKWGAPTTGILIGILTLALVGGCKEEIELSAGWAEQELLIDGRFNDWDESWTSYFPEQGAVIGLASDSANLYAMLRFRDPKWARIIKISGLELAIDIDGNKQKNFVLKYRGGPTPDQMRRAGDGAMPFDSTGESMHGFPGGGRMMRDGEQREFTCYIKDRIEEKNVPVDGSEGPRAAFDIDQGFYTYEFAIPLAYGAVRYYGLGAEPGRTISIGAVWGDMEHLRGQGGKRGGMSGGMPGGGMPGGGGMGGGMPGGGRGGGMGGGRPEMPEKQEVWIKTTLAEISDTETGAAEE